MSSPRWSRTAALSCLGRSLAPRCRAASLRVRNTPWRFGQCECSAHVVELDATRTGAAGLPLELTRPHKSISTGEAAAQSDAFGQPLQLLDERGRTTGPARIEGFGDAAASVRRPGTGYGPLLAARPRNAARPARGDAQLTHTIDPLREHPTDGVDRRRHLAQHLQHARVMVPPFERGLELVEIKHDVPQVIRSRLLARSAS